MCKPSSDLEIAWWIMISILKKKKKKKEITMWHANNKHKNHFVKMLLHLWLYVHTLNFDVKKLFFFEP